MLLEKVTAEHLMEIPGTEQQSRSEKWFSERWPRLTASKCLSAFKVGKLVTDCQPNAAVEANKFIFSHIWGLESEHFQSYWMRYGLESEPKAIQKYESTTNLKVYPSGHWVNPKFPFLGCSPDGLVGSDTVINIKSFENLEAVQCGGSHIAYFPSSKKCSQQAMLQTREWKVGAKALSCTLPPTSANPSYNW